MCQGRRGKEEGMDTDAKRGVKTMSIMEGIDRL